MSRRTRRDDPELAAGSRAHYDDPTYYAQAYRRRVDDVRFYEDVARASRGPVLEYGCGNGRITLAMARRGIDVTGVDLSAPMLADLDARLAREPDEVRARVVTKRGDMRKVRFSKRFPLVICPFNTFLHLYTREDVEAFLARVTAHLTPRGRFVLDVRMPDAGELARDPARAYASPKFRYPEADGRPGEVVRYQERFDYDRSRQVLFVSMEFTPEGGEGWMTPLAHRQFYPEELRALLHYNGLAIEEEWGDFERGPVTQASCVLVLACRPKTAR